MLATGNAYNAFLEGRPIPQHVHSVPPSLLPLLSLLCQCAATDHPLFSKGAGKKFVVQLLSLSSAIGELWVVRANTTTNPLTDCCGIVPCGRDPKLTGVADLKTTNYLPLVHSLCVVFQHEHEEHICRLLLRSLTLARLYTGFR